MTVLANNNLTDLQQTIVDYTKYISNWFDNSYIESNMKTFKYHDDIWYLKRAYKNNSYMTLNFNYCNDMIHNQNDCILMKCFFATMLFDGYSNETVLEYYTAIRKIYVLTFGFIKLNEMSDAEILFHCTKNNNICLYVIIRYLEFVVENDFYNPKDNYLIQLLNRLNNISVDNKLSVQSRELPSNTDISIFQYYINRYELNEQNSYIKALFYPVLIWWKLSIIIPMRPSEITYTLDKNCLFRKNGVPYIKINRIKTHLIHNNAIPLMKELCISEELFDLINEYQALLPKDDTSVTLFSISFIRNTILSLAATDNWFSNHTGLFKRNYAHYTHFEARDLNQLIDLFYDYYISYKCSYKAKIQHLRAGDTRHLAFSSLLLQHINPIDIAMIGGHTSLRSLNAYVNHIDLYVTSEIYRYYNNLNINAVPNNYILKDKIKKIPIEAPDNIVNAVPDEYGIGYCIHPAALCEDDLCFFCSNWWCKPTKSNIIKAQKYVRENNLAKIKSNLESDKKMLITLLNQAKIEVIQGKIILREEYYSKYRKLIKSIRSKVSRLEVLKEALISNFDSEENR